MAVSPRRRLVATALVTMLVMPVAACSKEAPDATLNAFLSGWETGKLGGLSLLSPDGQALSDDAAAQALTTIEGDLAGRRPDLTLKGKPAAKDDNATATVGVSWPVTDTVTWEYDTSVTMRRVADKWRVLFGAKTVHPDLGPTDKLAIRQTKPGRGSIVDGAGAPLVANRDVVVLGVEPRRVTDINLVVTKLNEAFAAVSVAVDLTNLPARVQSAKADAFVEIVTLRKEAYDQITNQLNAVVGLVTRRTTLSLGPSPQFARALLGTSGEVTKEILDKNPGKYKVGDIVGYSGMQQRYDDALRGTPGVAVVIPMPTGTPDKPLFTVEPKAGATIKTTLDPAIQNAAEGALALDARRSALVAIRVSDGAVVAVANGPGAAVNNFALLGQTAPGSTFKMVSALGLLDAGSVELDQPVDCPQTITVDGRVFRNANNFALGLVPFRVDFAKSCNTAFAALAPNLGADGLAKTATTLGIGVPWDLGVDAFTGKVSTGGSAAERAAATFGQGTTLTSPIALAGAAAAVARGKWTQPKLILEPAPAKPAADGPDLNAESLEALRTMMREVVTVGSADALKDLPGDLRGKTGTAEFTANGTTGTHSWFVGYRGDIAFCVFVENGGASTAAAVPIAGKFFTTLG